ncbi:hypothetical protein NL64_06325 [Pseudomonas fluorescens]|uniref:hypothetical protein n=1 Tax=Pseudomonas fluorescens TaxID=294 RepID=UPI00054BC334|nr:hypothetical protein [Pseudomonas fluorescens]KII34874.1 hypothetical protein NL64_06325 [Pseudomonas fluorescens]
MSKAQVNPLQAIVNAAAVKVAEAQYRLANLFTPYSFDPERVDFDRVGAFLGNVNAAFPQPSEAVKLSLDRTAATLVEQQAILAAFKAQGTEPTLSADELFDAARNSIAGNRLQRAA